MLPSGDGVPSIGGQVTIGDVDVGVGGVIVVVVVGIDGGGQSVLQACAINLSRMAISPLKLSTKK